MAAYLSTGYWWFVVNCPHKITGYRLFFCLQQHLSLFSSWLDEKEENNIYYCIFILTATHFLKFTPAVNTLIWEHRHLHSLIFVSYISLGSNIHLSFLTCSLQVQAFQLPTKISSMSSGDNLISILCNPFRKQSKILLMLAKYVCDNMYGDFCKYMGIVQ